MPVTLPFEILPNTLADAEQVNSNFVALAAYFGSIVDADLAAGADINGSKMSTTSNARRIPRDGIADAAISGGLAGAGVKIAADTITVDNMADDAIEADKIKADAVTTVKILDANVTAAKLAAGALLGALDVQETTVPPNVSVNNSRVTVAVNPGTARPVASWDLVGLFWVNYSDNTTGGINDYKIAVGLHSIDTATNWSALIRINDDGGTGGTVVAGKIKFVFAPK